MVPLSRRTKRALAVGAGVSVVYAASVAYRRARDNAYCDPQTTKRRKKDALAALEKELQALDEETLRSGIAGGSDSDSFNTTSTHGDTQNRNTSEDSLVSTSAGSGTDSFAERLAVNESRDDDDDLDEVHGKNTKENTNDETDATPNFFASTKFFACLELEESRELFQSAAESIELLPGQVVFRQGDDSSSGIYIVERGSLGVYLQEEKEHSNGNLSTSNTSGNNPSVSPLSPPFLTNILREGESVGDVDVLDNAPRGVSVVAGDQGAKLVRIGQKELFQFIDKHPRTLETYVTQAVARLWRVAHFVLVDFLGLPKPQGDAVGLGGAAGVINSDTETDHHEEENAEDNDVIKKNKERVSPAQHLMTHVEALKRHCPVLVDEEGRVTGDTGDVVTPDTTTPDTTKNPKSSSRRLYSAGDFAECMFLVLKGVARADAVPWPKGDGQRGPPSPSPALIGASAFLTRSARQETVRVDGVGDGDGDGDDDDDECVVLRVGAAELDALRVHEPRAYVAVLLAATTSLSLLLRQFISLGLNRVWLRSGESAYEAGEVATSMFVLISGRVRLLRGGRDNSSDEHVRRDDEEEEEDTVTNGSGTTASSTSGTRSGFGSTQSRKNEERGRGETIGEAPLLANGVYPSTTVCLRDSELVRMSKGALTLVCARYPQAASRVLEAMARKLHATMGSTRSRPDLVTITLVPAGPGPDEVACSKLAFSLRTALTQFGPTLWLDEQTASQVFTDGTVGKLSNAFYRSKLTGWMAQQEENYRFILLQADSRAGAWSQVCVSQADRVVVVARVTAADREDEPSLGKKSWIVNRRGRVDGVMGKQSDGFHRNQSEPQNPFAPSKAERRLLWRRRRGAAVELVLVHDPGVVPCNTAQWRTCRPEVQRHHMLRLGSDDDVRRVARHVAGRAVGVVLTGGGGHGLAHLGALRALEDAGVPVDVVGGTSRGALVAALYAKYASTTHMLPGVKELVGVLSSQRHLLTDLTLPVLSLFSGKGLDKVLRRVLGHDTIEDLWLPFFCCSTNLTKGRLTTHTRGTVWKNVRSSMTTLGLLPPVVDENNELQVDGGYLNPVPVDVMRQTLSADIVIVIDVADDDYLAFRDLTPRDGGLGGWRLLWERVNPFLGLEEIQKVLKKAHTYFPGMIGGVFGDITDTKDTTTPSTASKISYASLLGALLHATSTRQFREANRKHAINLYLRPPGVSGWTHALTPVRVDQLVRRAHAHSSRLIQEWQQDVERNEVERHTMHDVNSVTSAVASMSIVSGDGESARRHVAGVRTPNVNVPEVKNRPEKIVGPLVSPSSYVTSMMMNSTGTSGNGSADFEAELEGTVSLSGPRESSRKSSDEAVKTRSVTLPPPDESPRLNASLSISSLSNSSFGTAESPSTSPTFLSTAGSRRLSSSFHGSPFVSASDLGAADRVKETERNKAVMGSALYRTSGDAKTKQGTAADPRHHLAGTSSLPTHRASESTKPPRHVRRHSAHVDAAKLARALLVSQAEGRGAKANNRTKEMSTAAIAGVPVFGALLARRAEEEAYWASAFGGVGVARTHAAVRTLRDDNRHPRRRSLSAGDLAALVKHEADGARDIKARGHAA